MGLCTGTDHRRVLLFRKSSDVSCAAADVEQLPGNWAVSDFFSSYFAIPFMIIFYFGYKIIKRSKIIPLMDLPVGQFIALAEANPEPEPTPRHGPLSWLAKFWWD